MGRPALTTESDTENSKRSFSFAPRSDAAEAEARRRPVRASLLFILLGLVLTGGTVLWLGVFIQSGEIRLGVIPTIGPFMLPHLLAELRKSYPKLKLYLREALSAQLLQQLQEGKLDLAILAFPYVMPDMETLSMFRDDFVLCLPPGHQLEKSKQVKQYQLQGESLLLLEEGHCLRDHALEACKLESADTDLVYQGTSLHTLVQMVANGLGVTLLPAISVAGDVLGDTHLKIKEFNNENVSREIGMSWRKSDPRREEYLLLADFVKENTPGAKPLA